MAILARWLLSALAISVTAYVLNRGVHIADFQAALAAAFILGIVNITIKPLLLLLTLPSSYVTLGIITFTVNTLMIFLSAEYVPGIILDSLWWVLIFSVALTIAHYFIYKVFEVRI